MLATCRAKPPRRSCDRNSSSSGELKQSGSSRTGTAVCPRASASSRCRKRTKVKPPSQGSTGRSWRDARSMSARHTAPVNGEGTAGRLEAAGARAAVEDLEGRVEEDTDGRAAAAGGAGSKPVSHHFLAFSSRGNERIAPAFFMPFPQKLVSFGMLETVGAGINLHCEETRQRRGDVAISRSGGVRTTGRLFRPPEADRRRTRNGGGISPSPSPLPSRERG